MADVAVAGVRARVDRMDVLTSRDTAVAVSLIDVGEEAAGLVFLLGGTFFALISAIIFGLIILAKISRVIRILFPGRLSPALVVVYFFGSRILSPKTLS